jgi:YD repeat-containing protein
MAFGLGPYGIATIGIAGTSPPPSTPTTLVSSKQIDGRTNRYVYDSNGNPVGMPDLQQRVQLLIDYGVTMPALIGSDFESATEAQIRNALKPLTDRPADAVIQSIEVSSDLDTSYVRIVFQDGQVVEV